MEVDEESLATEIGRIEEIEVVCLERVQSIDAVGGFIGVDAGGDVFDVVDPHEKCEYENECESTCGEKRGFISRSHCVLVFFFFGTAENFLSFIVFVVELPVWIGIWNTLTSLL